MMNIAFKKAESAADIALIAQTARIIWLETYLPILGREQVDYMIEKFQSASALTGQLASGYVYDIIFCDGEVAGFAGYKRENDGLFLSKLYILKEYRGRKLASKTVERLAEICKKESLKYVFLTVNRQNSTAIAVYTKLGFVNERSEDNEIGRGYYMNDYIMYKYI